MAKRSKAKRGRPPKKIKSVVYRVTFSLDPVKHAPIIALMESTPDGQRSQTLIDVLMSKVTLSFGGTGNSQPLPEVTIEPEREISFALDDF